MWFEVKSVELLILIVTALYFDVRFCRIKNEIVLAGLTLGILTNYIDTGVKGVTDSIFGIIMPVIILFILFSLKMLGAGDIKLFSAIGAIMGLKFGCYLIITSVIAGGVWAIIIVFIRKNSVTRFKYLYNYIKLCLITFKIHEYQEMIKEDKGLFRFTYAIASGTIITLIANNHLI